MASPKKSRNRKYGSRDDYTKIVKAKAAANKLFKRGITKVDPAKQEWRVDKYGRATPKSRALSKALSDWHEYTTSGGRAQKLSASDIKAIKKTWGNAPTAPTVTNGHVMIGKGLSLKIVDGHASFVPTGMKNRASLDLSMATSPEEAKKIVEKWAKKNPGSDIYVARTETITHRQTLHQFANDKGGIELALEAFYKYQDESIDPDWHVSFMFGPSAKAILKANKKARDERERDYQRQKKRAYRSGKRGKRTGRGH